MAQAQVHKEMLKIVANALGSDLLGEVVFVGGCTTSLFITDDYVLEQVRHTDDVDLVVEVANYNDWAELSEKLKARGFTEWSEDDAPLCSFSFQGLRVDFMPPIENILGFSNKWYPEAVKTAKPYALTENITIRLVDVVYFIATKLEAYKGRGNGDAFMSQDIEDVLNLLHGRDTIVEEVKNSNNQDVKRYIADGMRSLIASASIEMAVKGCVYDDPQQATLLFETLAAIAQLE